MIKTNTPEDNKQLTTLPPVVIKEGRGKNQKEVIVPEDENI